MLIFLSYFFFFIKGDNVLFIVTNYLETPNQRLGSCAEVRLLPTVFECILLVKWILNDTDACLVEKLLVYSKRWDCISWVNIRTESEYSIYHHYGIFFIIAWHNFYVWFIVHGEFCSNLYGRFNAFRVHGSLMVCVLMMTIAQREILLEQVMVRGMILCTKGSIQFSLLWDFMI